MRDIEKIKENLGTLLRNIERQLNSIESNIFDDIFINGSIIDLQKNKKDQIEEVLTRVKDITNNDTINDREEIFKEKINQADESAQHFIPEKQLELLQEIIDVCKEWIKELTEDPNNKKIKMIHIGNIRFTIDKTTKNIEKIEIWRDYVKRVTLKSKNNIKDTFWRNSVTDQLVTLYALAEIYSEKFSQEKIFEVDINDITKYKENFSCNFIHRRSSGEESKTPAIKKATNYMSNLRNLICKQDLWRDIDIIKNPSWRPRPSFQSNNNTSKDTPITYRIRIA